jgi:hypothetical protein
MDGMSVAPRGPIWTRERRRLLWAVRVRWAVIAGFSALALSFHPFGVFADLAALLTAGTVGCAANLINHACVRRDRAIVAALCWPWRWTTSGSPMWQPRPAVHSPMVIMHQSGGHHGDAGAQRRCLAPWGRRCGSSRLPERSAPGSALSAAKSSSAPARPGHHSSPTA